MTIASTFAAIWVSGYFTGIVTGAFLLCIFFAICNGEKEYGEKE